MKTRFNTFDIVCTVTELQKLVGMRVNNVYDIDNKTYLIRLQRSEEKNVLLFESGNRIHTTIFEWPKNMAPSGFSMKMRKHLKNKRLESLRQLGMDRIIDMQFGSGEAAYHVILELYDRGNVILTDFEFTILNVLRPHAEGDKVKFMVKEKYPQDRAREVDILNSERILEILQKAKPTDQLKKVLVSNSDYGPAVIEHVLLRAGFNNAAKIEKDLKIPEDAERIATAMTEAQNIMEQARNKHSKGFIIQKKEERPITEKNQEQYFYSNQEFHPILFEQCSTSSYKEFDTFNLAVDEFFSSLESQKIDMKAVHQEKEAMKKLENVRKDHDQRLVALEKTQEVDKQKAELITRNLELVEKAILAIQTALANQVSWQDLEDSVKEAAIRGDPVAKHIKKLKLEINHVSLMLHDTFAEDEDSNESSDEDTNDGRIPSMIVDIDLALTAFANARRFYDQKRSAAKKQQKTIESQTKALKSAEKKTKQTLKEVQLITNINKARKTYWFEKFFWFISSENYLVIGGRDQQQNELIVKRYLRPTDVYVHADVHGASSIIIKNPSGQAVPPKTTNEAGTMAICYSVAWEAKVVTNAYWVWGDQVSKTAPTGEYLSTGSFMIRGKKNFLPPSHLVLGMGFVFRLEDSFVEKHKGERKVLTSGEEDDFSNLVQAQNNDEVEVEVLDESEEDEDKQKELKTDENDDLKEDKSNEEKPSFPDTQIKIKHDGGTKINIVTERFKENDDDTEDQDTVVFLGDDKPILVKKNQENNRSRGNSESKNKSKVEFERRDSESSIKQQNQTKRGQKSKLKKIKEKYKDQDDEERKLRMEILQSSGSSKEKETKKVKKGKETHSNSQKKGEPRIPKPFVPKDANVDQTVDDEEIVVQADVDMIDALTGIPVDDDELLFAIPVIAPYNTLANYKFKVKLTPGTNRRGKAARTAVSMFLKDRSITSREKDLLKAVKDEQLVRNLPGKVKLSAPRLQTLKK